MELNNLSLEDKEIFAKHLGRVRHELSVYAFENIYIWKGLFKIYWMLIEGNLCVFFQDKIGCFMYLAPQYKTVNPRVVRKSFSVMDSFNKNKDISRIENIEANDIAFYQDLGYECQEKFFDYLCRRAELVQLKGDKFKSKRACCNYFIKHYKFEYLPFDLKYRQDCLKLYDNWAKGRKVQNQDSLYQNMLVDGRICLKILLEDYPHLDIIGRIVRIGREIMAFTFGFKLNKDTLCILYEVTDLSIKGLSQFIFRQFCSEFQEYRYINIMDDSGLENLKKVKLSYHPQNFIPAYIAKRKNAEKYR